ncbi:arsenate reductase ArsC [Polynucleobacter sp. MG-5-Ahmo-C2]|jgi:arsenate reductase|uniref:arsenate reductase ArsC n=1 Tax=unclassified Polynucleobacter TaxID=2640945 RepID=UPI001BFE3EBC|nr:MULTISPECIES: arsenate reductase ArsC [unclassified Polynucleobacter]QWD71604.1 arsenate reductase ArsC [Polynucleobacter sp. UB-Raua-W9]QWD97691.1 arsenate reductase ArsC [Polynucleobacter sp. MG-5-Ahmo-C2]
MTRPYNILFLCTGNSARSIIGEALATTLSHGRFIGYSAGSSPKQFVHPIALKLAREMGYPLELLRSKTWDEFGTENAPHMDFIITVCDSAAGEECPYWPGHPTTAHWGFMDPAAVTSSEQDMWDAFRKVEMGLRNRIELLLDLPIDKLDHLQIKDELNLIHKKFN